MRTRTEWEEVFRPLERISERLNLLGKDGPAPRSDADRERRTHLGRVAWTLSLSAAIVGAEHLEAWRDLLLIAKMQPTFAHLSLIRAAAEGTAVARWICDRSITSEERLRRAAGAQLEDYEERIKWERRLGARAPQQTGQGRTGTQRRDEFDQLLRANGVRPAAVPSTTEFFARYFFPDDPEGWAGESIFRQISGVIHAKVWSILSLSDRSDPVRLASGLLSVQVRADDELAFTATYLTMRLAEAAAADLAAYGSASVQNEGSI